MPSDNAACQQYVAASLAAQPAVQPYFASRINSSHTFFDGRNQREKDAAYESCKITLPQGLLAAQPVAQPAVQPYFASRINSSHTFFDGRNQREKDAAYKSCEIKLPEGWQ